MSWILVLPVTSRHLVFNMLGFVVSSKARTVATLVFVLAASTQPLQAESTNSAADSLAREIKQVFQTTSAAVCRVIAVDDHGVHNGTGFFIDPNGTIATTYSIGGSSNDITIVFGNNKYVASRILTDSRSGLVLLKVNAITDFLTLAQPEKLPIASPVIAVGYAMDLTIAPTFGTVAGHDLKYQGRYLPVTHMRVNLPVARGQTGSPILNMDGEVVGVLVSAIDGGVACYALPVAVLDKVVNDYAQFGLVRYGWVGVTVEPSIAGYANSSAKIVELEQQSPAKGIGIKVGDLLLQIDKYKVESLEDVLDASYFLSPGQEIELVVSRAGERKVFKTTVEDHPANPKLLAQPPAMLDDDNSGSLQLGN